LWLLSIDDFNDDGVSFELAPDEEPVPEGQE